MISEQIVFAPPNVAGISLEASPAGFWIRLGAFVIDAAFLFSIDVFLLYSSGIRFGLPTRLGSMVVSTLYFGLTTGAWGQSFGKMLAGVAVVRDEDGGPIGYPRAFGRALAHFVSGIVLGMGYFVAAFTPEKRALHDFMAGTRVVFPQPVAAWRKTAIVSTGVVGVSGCAVFMAILFLLAVRGAHEIEIQAQPAGPTPAMETLQP